MTHFLPEPPGRMDPFSFFAAPFATFRAVWASIQGWPYFFPQPLRFQKPRRFEFSQFFAFPRSSTFAMSRSSYRICNPTTQTPPFFTLGGIFNLHRLKTARPTLPNLLSSLHPNFLRWVGFAIRPYYVRPAWASDMLDIKIFQRVKVPYARG